jgi:integrase
LFPLWLRKNATLRIKSIPSTDPTIINFSGFFKFLIANEAIEVSPLDGIKFNRGAPYRRKPILLENDLIQEFIETAKRLSSALFYPIFLLVNETAAKTSDILALQWKDIGLKNGTIDLVRSKELRQRQLSASERLIQALQRIDRVSVHVFTGLEGQPFKQYILCRELKRFQRQAVRRTGASEIFVRPSEPIF